MGTSDADITPEDAYVESRTSDNPAGGEQPGHPVEPPIETQAKRKATRFDSRGEALDEADYYCPACGRRYNYLRECSGTPAAPHAPVEVVSTDELQGDPESHTAAPASE